MGGMLDKKYDWLDAKTKAVGIMNRLKGVGYYKICGSIRRKKKKVGDIDVVAILNDRNAFENSVWETADEMLAIGPQNVRFISKDIQTDIMVVEPDQFESACLHFTGSKFFNIRCRSAAKKMGCTLNEYGLWDKEGNRVEGTELGIISRIGMKDKYCDPTNR